MSTYLYIAAAALAAYYFRRYWLTPWGEYVSHTGIKAGDVFMVVRRVRWYPPFLSFNQTFHTSEAHNWSEEKTGWVPRGDADGELVFNRQDALNAMLIAARARQRETEELFK